MTDRTTPNRDFRQAAAGAAFTVGLVCALLFLAGCASPDPLDDPTGGGADWPRVTTKDYDAKECFARAALLHGRALQEKGTKRRELFLQAQAWRRLGLAENPANAREHERYIAVMQELGRDDPAWLRRAVAEYRERLEAHRDSSLFAWLYAWTLTLRPTVASLQTAREVLVHALERHPRDYWLNYRMGVICMALDDVERARTHLQRAADVGPNVGRFDASYLLGQLHAGLGEYSDAARQLQTVVDHDRNAGMEVYENLARMLANTGDFDRAKQVLLHDLPPWMVATRGPHHLRTVGAVYLAEGDLPRAADAWRSWLRLFPRAPRDERIEVEEALDAVEWRLQQQGQ